MRMFRAAYLITTFLVLAGCVAATNPAPMQPMPLQQRDGADLDTLQRQQYELSRQMAQLQDNLLLLEARVLDQQQLIEQMRANLPAQKVTGTGEKTGSPPPPAAPVREIPSTTSASATETYLQAFANYASGNYAEAVLGFETFLRHFPDNDYAANAQYWLGECYLAQQLHTQAAEEFQKTFNRYPRGAKTPDALLKLASTYQQMNQPDRATATLQILRQSYPGSSAARQAAQEQ